jgi:hypothetical protein
MVLELLGVPAQLAGGQQCFIVILECYSTVWFPRVSKEM